MLLLLQRLEVQRPWAVAGPQPAHELQAQVAATQAAMQALIDEHQQLPSWWHWATYPDFFRWALQGLFRNAFDGADEVEGYGPILRLYSFDGTSKAACAAIVVETPRGLPPRTHEHRRRGNRPRPTDPPPPCVRRRPR